MIEELKNLVPTRRSELSAIFSRANPLIERGLGELFSKEVNLQALLAEGKIRGYLTFGKVSDCIKVRVYRIESDGPLKLLPDNAENRRFLDRLLVELSEYSIELVDDTEAVHFDPDNIFAYIHSACSWYAKGEFEKAFRDFQEVSMLNTKYILDSVSEMEYPRAINRLSAVIRELNGKNLGESDVAAIYYIRGLLKLGWKDVQMAVEDFDIVYKLDSAYLELMLIEVDFRKVVSDEVYALLDSRYWKSTT